MSNFKNSFLKFVINYFKKKHPVVHARGAQKFGNKDNPLFFDLGSLSDNTAKSINFQTGAAD